MKTKDKYLKEMNTFARSSGSKKNHVVIDLKGAKKDIKKKKRQEAEKRNDKIVKLMGNVIDTSALYRDGLITREEYKDFMKSVIKVI